MISCWEFLHKVFLFAIVRYAYKVSNHSSKKIYNYRDWNFNPADILSRVEMFNANNYFKATTIFFALKNYFEWKAKKSWNRARITNLTDGFPRIEHPYSTILMCSVIPICTHLYLSMLLILHEVSFCTWVLPVLFISPEFSFHAYLPIVPPETGLSGFIPCRLIPRTVQITGPEVSPCAYRFYRIELCRLPRRINPGNQV